MKLYHVTPIRNIESIRKYGLKPSRRKGFSSKVSVARPLRRGYLYFVDSPEAVGDLLTALAAYQGRSTKLALFEIDTEDSYPFFLESDVNPNSAGMWSEFLVSKEAVPSSRIRYVGVVKTGHSKSPDSQLQDLGREHIPSTRYLPRDIGSRIKLGAKAAVYGPITSQMQLAKESTDKEELDRIEKEYGTFDTGFKKKGKKDLL